MRRRRKRATRRFRLTREGKAFVFVTLGVGFAAINTANNLLYLVLALLLSLLLVSGVLSDLALWRLRVSRHLPSRVFAGTESLVEIAAFNEKRWLASVSVEALDEVADARTEAAHFIRVEPRSGQRTAYALNPFRRGRFRFSDLHVATRFPFGLIEKGYSVSLPEDLIVYPRLLQGTQTPALDQVDGDLASMPRLGQGSEFAGSVRYYREGDEARQIHWQRTAARGELVVRERQREAQSRLTLHIQNMVDPRQVDMSAWREAFEEQISELATVAAAYLNRGVSVEVRASGTSSTLVPGGTPPDPIWRFLALLTPVIGHGRQGEDPTERVHAA